MASDENSKPSRAADHARGDLSNEVSNAGSKVRRPRLLLMKLGAIGDVVMAIPAAAAAHARGLAIDWVVSETVAPVLRLYPWINVLEVDEGKLLRGSFSEQVSHLFRLWRTLRRQNQQHGPYDTAATLYYDRRYRLLSLFVSARRRVVLSRADRHRTLLPGRHHTDEYDRLLTGRLDGERASQLAPVPAGSLPPVSRLQNPERPRIVLVPAGARNVLRDDALRRWPIEHYLALAEALLRDGCEVLLSGGSDDHWASPHFAAIAASAPPGAFADLIGQLPLPHTLALFDSAVVTVTHDTGPLHLAGLTSTGIVTIFGPTDPHGRLPWRSNTVALWGGEGFACRPCYDGRGYAPCSHNGCMSQVTPAMVQERVLELLQARRDGRSLPPRILAPPPAGFAQLRPESHT